MLSLIYLSVTPIALFTPSHSRYYSLFTVVNAVQLMSYDHFCTLYA